MSSVGYDLFPEWNIETRKARGILPAQDIRDLIQKKMISAEAGFPEDQVQPASIDLRLGRVAYRVQAGFLPGKNLTVERKIRELCMFELDLSQPTVLERGCVYIIRLMESLRLPRNIAATANPKSTTGRLDIFTRLITDCGDEFERVPEGYTGPLHVEVVPRTFTIVVQEGLKLNQLRFGRRTPELSGRRLSALDHDDPLVYLEEEGPAKAYINRGLRVSVSLQGNEKNKIVAFKARRNTPTIDLRYIARYDPQEYWEFISEPAARRIILDPTDFYVLASREKVRVPPDFAAEMVPIDPSIGEFRIHYAGFFDPGFGDATGDAKGTRAVLEVRAHEVPFLIEEGQTVGRLVYMPLLSKPNKIYGPQIGSSYQNQSLALSKHFKNPH